MLFRTVQDVVRKLDAARTGNAAGALAAYLGFPFEGVAQGLPVNWPARKASAYPSTTRLKPASAVNASTAGRRSPLPSRHHRSTRSPARSYAPQAPSQRQPLTSSCTQVMG